MGEEKCLELTLIKKNIEYHKFLFWKFCKNDVHVSMYQKVQSDFFYLHWAALMKKYTVSEKEKYKSIMKIMIYGQILSKG